MSARPCQKAADMAVDAETIRAQSQMLQTDLQTLERQKRELAKGKRPPPPGRAVQVET